MSQTRSIANGFTDTLGQDIVAASTVTWNDLGSSPYASWSNWTVWNDRPTNPTLTITDDLGNVQYRKPSCLFRVLGDSSVVLKISNTGSFGGEEQTITILDGVEYSYNAGRYYRWAITAEPNSTASIPSILEAFTTYDRTLGEEFYNDLDLAALSVDSSGDKIIDTNLGLVVNVQGTALQGEPYVEDGYIIETQGTEYTRTPKSITNNGGVSTSTTSRVDDASLQFTGTEYLTIAGTGDFDHAANDFTYETWFRFDDFWTGSPTAGTLLSTQTGGDIAVQLRIFANALDDYSLDYDAEIGTSQYQNTSYSVDPDTWYHVALVRSGTSLLLYVDGTLVDTQTITDPSDALVISTPDILGVGANNAGNSRFEGYIDEARISTVARYTANFTPQATPFTNDSDTVLLLHGEDITDDGGDSYGTDNYIVEQIGGAVVIQQKNPPTMKVVDYQGTLWDGTVDLVLRGLPKIQTTTQGIE